MLWDFTKVIALSRQVFMIYFDTNKLTRNVTCTCNFVRRRCSFTETIHYRWSQIVDFLATFPHWSSDHQDVNYMCPYLMNKVRKGMIKYVLFHSTGTQLYVLKISM